MKPRLYDLTAQYATLFDSIMDSAVDGEILPEFADALAALEDDIKHKLAGCCMVIADLEAHGAACEQEAKRLAKRAASVTAHVKGLKTYMKDCLERADLVKLDTGLFRVSVCNNSQPSVSIVDLDAVPHKFDKVPAREVSLSAIAEAVGKGEDVPGAEVTRGKHLRIT